jgi:hypothetical protein
MKIPVFTVEVQTRSEEFGCRTFATVKDAMNHADEDTTVWKISFSLANGERVRLVSVDGRWFYEPVV